MVREFDSELIDIADYIQAPKVSSPLALDTALSCLLDALGCAVLALNHPQCTRLLNKPADSLVDLAFNIGTLIRWLDYNDTWLAAEWGHPSDNLGGILAVMAHASHPKKSTVQDCLEAMIRAYEIQGIIALGNSFNAVGLDHVILVKVATAGVATQLLGGDKTQILSALSHAFVDGQSLRTYRHAPNTGSRKSWAAGDATSRGIRLAQLVMRGEPGIKTALSAPTWGFYDVLFKGEKFKFSQPYGCYVMENILFKISYPAEFHGQTAIECALLLYVELNKLNKLNYLNNIKHIKIITQASAMRIINKTGVLNNPADRDHCLQYMVAVALLTGELTAESYSDQTVEKIGAQLDNLRSKMIVSEDLNYTQDYLDPSKRSIANKIEIYFNDGAPMISKEVEYPLGHKRRRIEGLPLLMAKFEKNLKSRLSEVNIAKINALVNNKIKLLNMPISEFLPLFL